ncbi:unnamed protein product [Linum trigynum]|uniref:Uncharacterized protein n=1 Tax=Linum trigynum TaxID=586398 RepID=A0AAV2CGI5_9ROSI
MTSRPTPRAITPNPIQATSIRRILGCHLNIRYHKCLMDLSKKPVEMDMMYSSHRNEEGQAEHKKRKHGKPLDFEGPYFTPGKDSNNNQNARIKGKGRKPLLRSKTRDKEGVAEQEDQDQQQYQVTSEVPVADKRRLGAE